MKTVLVGLLLAGSMLAETVYFGKASKVYHVTVSCSAKGGAHALQADKAEAEKHGLRGCKRCYAAKSGAAGGNGAWAKKAPAGAAVAGCGTDSECEAAAAKVKK
jgi:methylphosphotriester-DNA--protein-cysteine methyltransferase